MVFSGGCELSGIASRSIRHMRRACASLMTRAAALAAQTSPIPGHECHQNNHVEGLHGNACEAVPAMVCLLALHVTSLLHLGSMERCPAHITKMQDSSGAHAASPIGGNTHLGYEPSCAISTDTHVEQEWATQVWLLSIATLIV